VSDEVVPDDMLLHYARALDEIFRLRGLLAYEAGVTQAHLQLATFPRGRRAFAEAQVKRMTLAATGSSQLALTGVEKQSLALVRVRLNIGTLTRIQFENEFVPLTEKIGRGE
jgi:hypothetical protein